MFYKGIIQYTERNSKKKATEATNIVKTISKEKGKYTLKKKMQTWCTAGYSNTTQVLCICPHPEETNQQTVKVAGGGSASKGSITTGLKAGEWKLI